MSDFLATYQLTRGRFDDQVRGLTSEQLNFRLHAGVLTIGEMALHVAGVEFFVLAQLLDLELSPDHARLRRCARDGALNDNPFPYPPEEVTPELVKWALSEGRKLAESALADPMPELRTKENESALGPTIDGVGAMARLSYHAGYHQGQIYFVKSSPAFPSS